MGNDLVNLAEGGVDVDGMVFGPCDGEKVSVCVGVMKVS